MNKNVIWLVEKQNKQELDLYIENWHKEVGDTEVLAEIVIAVDEVEFVDSNTFRVSRDLIDFNDLLYFDGAWDGYYNKVFTNEEYAYYSLDGQWY